MKKFTAALFALLLTAAGLSGCAPQGSGDRLKVVCTIFPQYDWVRELTAGDDSVDLKLLQDSGQDLHNYQPTFQDALTIYQCDIFLYVGGESDDWAEEVLSSPSVNPEIRTVKLMELLGESALEEEDVPGAEEEHEEETELDEHVWLSLKNASFFCTEIARILSEKNPGGAELYKSNLDRYLGELSALETEYAETAETAARKILLFADRFPFRYLAEDYGLSYYAAFSGCSAETEASPSVVVRLAKALDEYELPYVLVLEGSDGKLARTVISSSAAKDQTILTMNSLQSVTAGQIGSGTNYLTLMRENLQTLRTALN